MMHIACSPYFQKIQNSPLFPQDLSIPPIFVRLILGFFAEFTFFAFPYFEHDA